MLWAIPLATAIIGGLKAEQQRKADNIDNQLQAELTKYSPWTGKSGTIHGVSGGFLDGSMRGGMSGLSLAQGIPDGEVAKSFDTSSYDLNQSSRLESPQLASEYSPKDTGYLGANTPQFSAYSTMESRTAPVGTLSSDYLQYPSSVLDREPTENGYSLMGASDSDLSRLYRQKYLRRG